jgi:hypothetical protein
VLNSRPEKKTSLEIIDLKDDQGEARGMLVRSGILQGGFKEKKFDFKIFLEKPSLLIIKIAAGCNRNRGLLSNG